MSNDRVTIYDSALPAEHLYLGLTDEHKCEFPSCSLFPNGTKLEYPLLASNFCLFPGEILPIISDDGDVMNLFERVRNSENGYVFHLAHESDEDTNDYGVILQLTHCKIDDERVIAKLTAFQIIRFRGGVRLGMYRIDPFLFNLKVMNGEAVKEELSESTLNACDPNWIAMKRRNCELPKNLLTFLSKNSWDKLKEKIRNYYRTLQMDDECLEHLLSDKPAFVSYHLVTNVPMTVKEKEYLLGENIESRIRYCIDNLLARFVSITCNHQNCLLARQEDFVYVSRAGVCQVFVNPAGYYFTVATIRSNHRAFGTSDNTWYPNYNWGYLMCECDRHHGWGYYSSQESPEMFACIHSKHADINRLPDDMLPSERPKPEDRVTGEKQWTVRY